jgi:hypothetical protein
MQLRAYWPQQEQGVARCQPVSLHALQTDVYLLITTD